MNNNEHTDHYVACDWGIGYMHMRQKSFMAVSAAKFSTHQDNPRMDFESACYWNELAGKSNIIFC